ncbi:hypothetical protein [Candidatus Acidianus copahuensis]|nr:hypothetical protein [Candidatus Acidianus copahuensis]
MGPNLQLLSMALRESESNLEKYMMEIKHLYFTPLPSFSTVIFDGNFPVRKSIKSDVIFPNKKLKVNSIINYSGIPEAYDPLLDRWDLSFDIRANGMKLEGITENRDPLMFSTLRTSKAFTDIIKGMYNNLQIHSFIIDYGRRDIILDVISSSEEVAKNLEYVPFIRLTFSISEPKMYIIELLIPFNYLNIILEILKEMRDSIDGTLFTLRKMPYFTPII